MTPELEPHFVIGSGRSGTTIVAASMGMHPALRFIDEPRFLSAILLPASAGALSEEEFRRRVATSGDGSGKEPMKFLRRMREHYGEDLRDDVTEVMTHFWHSPRRGADVRAALGSIVDRVNARLGARSWLIKEPDLSLHAAALAELFPSARFIHLHRNVEDVLSSRLDRRFQPSFESALDVWAERLASIAAFASSMPDRIRHCRFETFVAGPATTLRELFGFLGCETSDDVVRRCASLVRGDDAHIGRAHERFDAAQRRLIATRAEPLERALGFALRAQASTS